MSKSDKVFDKTTRQYYTIGKLLGRGAFANCKEIFDHNEKPFAVKIFCKKQLVQNNMVDQLETEIDIHKSLQHENIVKFVKHLHDFKNHYIIMEICLRETLSGLVKRRRKVTEPEARYFITPIVRVCEYLHDKNIIHRDLKLENIFLTDKMVVKVGDFGLAVQLKSKLEKKTSMCGTPNYISPEAISKKPYSFDADSWSLGVILYVLITGKFPFVAKTREEIFEKIKKYDYVIPYDVSGLAEDVISSLLHSDVLVRPTMKNLLSMEFFQQFTPNSLPISVLSDEPRYDLSIYKHEVPSVNQITTNESIKHSKRSLKRPNEVTLCKNYFTSDLIKQIKQLLGSVTVLDGSSNVKVWTQNTEETVTAPSYWIAKWVDFESRFGYQLNDNSTGVLFADKTRIVLTSNNNNVQFIDSNGTETLHTIDNFHFGLAEKVESVKNFHKYMNEYLLKSGKETNNSETKYLERLPFIKSWIRNDQIVFMQLSNGTTQINFLKDHTKIILCPILSAVTYINAKRSFNTFPFSNLKSHGIIKELYDRLEKGLKVLEKSTSSEYSKKSR